jgi:hypothetical protein
LRNFYRSGDEALLRDGAVIAFRRAGDPAEPYWELAEALYERGAANLQIRPAGGVIRYTGAVSLEASLSWGGASFRLERRVSLPRAAGSNKLPLVLEAAAP